MEIRGHRRTYIASGPRLIVPELSVKTYMLILSFFLTKLMKLDKYIEILKQNNDCYNWSILILSYLHCQFTLHYIFTISLPLLDWCEILHLAFDKRVVIVNGFWHASRWGNTEREVVTGWTREAGVRNLERAIAGEVQCCTVGWMREVGKWWEIWVCSLVGIVGIVVIILNNGDVQHKCPVFTNTCSRLPQTAHTENKNWECQSMTDNLTFPIQVETYISTLCIDPGSNWDLLPS